MEVELVFNGRPERHRLGKLGEILTSQGWSRRSGLTSRIVSPDGGKTNSRVWRGLEQLFGWWLTCFVGTFTSNGPATGN